MLYFCFNLYECDFNVLYIFVIFFFVLSVIPSNGFALLQLQFLTTFGGILFARRVVHFVEHFRTNKRC